MSESTTALLLQATQLNFTNNLDKFLSYDKKNAENLISNDVLLILSKNYHYYVISTVIFIEALRKKFGTNFAKIEMLQNLINFCVLIWCHLCFKLSNYKCNKLT